MPTVETYVWLLERRLLPSLYIHFNPPGAWLKPRPSLTHAALVATFVAALAAGPNGPRDLEAVGKAALPTWFGHAQLLSPISLRRAQLFSQHTSSYVRLERALKKSRIDQEEIDNLDENAPSMTTTVTLSSCEADIMAGSEAAKEATYLSSSLRELGLDMSKPPRSAAQAMLKLDNKSAIDAR